MTPQGWLIEDFAAAGFVWVFAGALLGAGVGLAVGLMRGVPRGLGAGLLIWGLGNAVVAAGLVAYLRVDSTVLTLPPLRCQALGDGRNTVMHQLVLAVQRSGEPAHEVPMAATTGPCPELPGAALRVRLRTDALASTAPVIKGEPDDERGPAFAAIWALFGAFGLVAGGVLLATGRSRTTAAASAKGSGGVAPWRTRIGELLGLLGLAVFVTAFFGGMFLDGSTERAIQFGLRSAGTAFGIWLVSGLLAGTMTAVPAAVTLLIGGLLLLAAEVMRRL